MPRLHLTGGNLPSKYVELKKKIIIGKKSDCDIVLTEGGISRNHCEVYTDRNGFFYIKDLGSTNGTYVDGRKIAASTRLKEGALITLGPYKLAFMEKSKHREEKTHQVIPTDLKAKIHQLLLDEMDLKHSDFHEESEEDLRTKVEKTVRKLVQDLAKDIPKDVEKELLIKDVLDEALGLGPLEDLLADEEVDEIMVNAFDAVYVERKGKIVKTDKGFTSNQQVLSVIRRIIAPIGRRIDESSPMVDARLADGSRVNAIISPLALTGPTLTIRKFAADPFTAEDLISFDTMTPAIAKFLDTVVENRANICISGGTGSGKTTLLNVIATSIPGTDRIVTIEDAAELKLPQDHVVSLESKPPNIAGEGAIRIRELMINSLRMRPDRIIVGECRGAEALDMLQAMNTGHDGSLTTVHANTTRDALARLETMVLMAGLELPSRAIREQISSAIDFVIQLSRMPDGTRKLVEIIEITGMEGDTIVSQKVFEYKQKGFDKEHRVVGSFEPSGIIPYFIHKIKERGIPVDIGLFSNKRK